MRIPLSKSFRDRWRPPLSFFVAGVLCIMLLVPLAGVAFFRIYENQLIQATEAELIAQSAAIAAVAGEMIEQAGGPELPLGPALRSPPAEIRYDLSSREGVTSDWSPQLPELDLNRTPIGPGRPEPEATDRQPQPAYVAAGASLNPILRETQRQTLAGFRVLDFNGIVIAGSDDGGLSLEHVPEVAKALKGNYASALRERVVDNPRPIYSISRGTSVRVFVAMPIILDGRVAGVVYASRTPSNILRELYQKRGTVFSMVLFVLAGTFVVGFIFARAIAGPIKALTARSLRIGRGDRSAIQPLVIHGNREIHALSESMLDMSRRLFERNDYISTFANHVTHELKTPLTSIQGAAELLIDGGDDMNEAERARFLGNIVNDTERASMLLNRLRDLARADSVDIGGSCRLSEVLEDIRMRSAKVTLEAPADCVLPLSAENARIVFENLVDNSVRHGARKVVFDVRESEDILTVTVRDDGSGISAGNEKQIFDLFFTTRRETGGTGMGLGIIRALLKAHNAGIRLVPSDLGACFEISFDTRTS